MYHVYLYHIYCISLVLQTIFVDKNGVEVILDWTQTFRSSAVDLIDNKLTMKYNSNPVDAHKNCGFKTCHQMNKGKLYKCPLVSVLPDFCA